MDLFNGGENRGAKAMIELPEAVTIARQMDQELKGKRIKTIVRGSSPHKFAFYTRPAKAYQSILQGSTLGGSRDHGNAILTEIGVDYYLILGGGGERIIYHQSDDTLPKKHQLLLHFDDDTYLTVTVSGWGNVMLLQPFELADHPHVGEGRVSPISDAYTFEHFQGLFADLDEEDKRFVKYFAISDPGIWGVGNGCLQDILFRAKIHPRRRVRDLDDQERRALHAAAREMLTEATALGGRDCERDLFNQPGGYQRILHSKVVGEPCPDCSTPIEKIRFLGGASYFCPSCQVDPAT
jgi:formamidopyrimidine-DNA glycosylase